MKVHIPPYLLHRDALYDSALRTWDVRYLEKMWELGPREPAYAGDIRYLERVWRLSVHSRRPRA